MSRYAPQQLRNGAVLPSGLDLRKRGQPVPMTPKKGPYRAIVLATYVSTDDGNLRRKSVECDVVLVRTNLPLKGVPVQQRVHGLNDADLWIPRATSKTVTGAPLEETETLYDDYDGDLVLVDFIEGDPEFPVITGALSHEQTKRKIVAGSGWQEGDTGSRGIAHTRERYLHHRGTEFRINESGDVLFDTVGSYGSNDAEVPSPTGGQIRFRVKDAQRFTVECNGIDVLEVYKDGTGVHVDVGEGATEPMVLGSILKAVLSALTVPTAFGPSGTPINAASFDTFLSLLHHVR